MGGSLIVWFGDGSSDVCSLQPDLRVGCFWWAEGACNVLTGSGMCLCIRYPMGVRLLLECLILLSIDESPFDSALEKWLGPLDFFVE